MSNVKTFDNPVRKAAENLAFFLIQAYEAMAEICARSGSFRENSRIVFIGKGGFA